VYGAVLRKSTPTHKFSGSEKFVPLFQVIQGLLVMSKMGLSMLLHHLRVEGQPKDVAETQYFPAASFDSG